jgi:hypothetical protein
MDFPSKVGGTISFSSLRLSRVSCDVAIRFLLGRYVPSMFIYSVGVPPTASMRRFYRSARNL